MRFAILGPTTVDDGGGEVALPLVRRAKMPYIEAYVLNALGMAHDSDGSSRAASASRPTASPLLPSESWAEASALVDELGTPKLAELRAAVCRAA